MHIAYVHGYDGVSGPLLLGACLDAGAPLEAVHRGMRQLGLFDPQMTSMRLSHAIGMATAVQYATNAQDLVSAFQTYTALATSIAQSEAPERVKQRLERLLTRFAQAVERVYGPGEAGENVIRSPLLPEILSLGSAVAYALEELAIEQVIAAPIPLSTGFVDHGQGRVPRPHPLTAALSRNVPVHGEGVSAAGERTTVSGVAILTAFAERFGPLPDMTMTATGYGVSAAVSGESAPALQLFVGDTAGPALAERIAVIEANIDDMNPEFYEYVAERLFAHGALDVTLTPLFMKKNRPANTLTVLAPVQTVATLSNLMLQETSTFGVRIHEVWRHKLDRFHRHVETRYGTIPIKCGVLDGRIVQAAPEYEACKRIALEQGLPVRLVYAEAASMAAPWLTS